MSERQAYSKRNGDKFNFAPTAEDFRRFLKWLVVGMEQKIFLIIDGHRIHRVKKVQPLLESLDGQIELFSLPPYAPQLNPDELSWPQVKRRVRKQPAKSHDELKEPALHY